MYTHVIVLYKHTIHIRLYSVDQSQEPVAAPYLPLEVDESLLVLLREEALQGVGVQVDI